MDNIAVLIVSCDKYSDLWEPFFRLFRRYWPTCPYKVYLLSNTLSGDIPGVNSILMGEDTSWSDNLRLGLDHIPEEYVFLLLDDLFLIGKVDEKEVVRLFKWVVDSKVNYLRMNPYPRPDKAFNESVGVVSKGTIYRTSTVLSIWKKQVLKSLLVPGESAWDFEINGSIRSDSLDGFYSTEEILFPHINGVIKGKWDRKALKLISRIGVELNTQKRCVMGRKESFFLYFRRKRTFLLHLLPSRHRRAIKNFMLGGKFHYKSI